jgi:hypothetical protein
VALVPLSKQAQVQYARENLPEALQTCYSFLARDPVDEPLIRLAMKNPLEDGQEESSPDVVPAVSGYPEQGIRDRSGAGNGGHLPTDSFWQPAILSTALSLLPALHPSADRLRGR